MSVPDAPGPEPVLACTLTGAEQADRARWLERLREQALEVERRADGVTLRFACDDDRASELRALAAAEAECCPFLTISVRQEGDVLELSVTAPAEGGEVVSVMFERAG